MKTTLKASKNDERFPIMKTSLTGCLIFVIGLITLGITVVISLFTGNIRLESLRTLSLGENFHLLFGDLMVPFIIGVVLSVVGFLIFFVGNVINSIHMAKSFH